MQDVEIEKNEIFMGRLAPGQDLLQALEDLCKAKDARLGVIHGIGAVKKAVIGYFDQEAGNYIENRLNEPMEIVALNANISILHDRPFVHAHIALGDRKGRMYGGHLMPGTEIFVFEYELTIGEGLLKRRHDKDLNLNLWDV